MSSSSAFNLEELLKDPHFSAGIRHYSCQCGFQLTEIHPEDDDRIFILLLAHFIRDHHIELPTVMIQEL